MKIPIKEKPDNIEAFDPSRRKTIPVDLNAPFFRVDRHPKGLCHHDRAGVTLDVPTRKVYCKCGEELDAFDALLIYAHAERRLQETRHAIEEHERKEAEKKAKAPYVKAVTGFARHVQRNGRLGFGYDLSLECGHKKLWWRKRPPRTATCEQCYRDDQLKAKGVGVLRQEQK